MTDAVEEAARAINYAVQLTTLQRDGQEPDVRYMLGHLSARDLAVALFATSALLARATTAEQMQQWALDMGAFE